MSLIVDIHLSIVEKSYISTCQSIQQDSSFLVICFMTSSPRGFGNLENVNQRKSDVKYNYFGTMRSQQIPWNAQRSHCNSLRSHSGVAPGGKKHFLHVPHLYIYKYRCRISHNHHYKPYYLLTIFNICHFTRWLPSMMLCVNLANTK